MVVVCVDSKVVVVVRGILSVHFGVLMLVARRVSSILMMCKEVGRVWAAASYTSSPATMMGRIVLKVRVTWVMSALAMG